MRLSLFLFVLTVATSCKPHTSQQTSIENEEILSVVEDFFVALEKQDTALLQNLFGETGTIYLMNPEGQEPDRILHRSPADFRFSPDKIIKERMRPSETTVSVQNTIAVVWAPYDLWINETFSHCGVDIFTMFKTSRGWKIASAAYTIEKSGCQ